MINATALGAIVRTTERELGAAYKQVLADPMNMDNQRAFQAILMKKNSSTLGMNTLIEHQFNCYKKIMESS